MRDDLPKLPLVLASTGLLLLAGCGQSEPCVICPDVAGVYDIVADSAPPERSSCGTLYFFGFNEAWTFEQDGSLLRIAELDANGTLFEDSTASFERITDLVDHSYESISWTVSGEFVDPDGRMRLEGYILARTVDSGCRLNTRFAGSRRE